MANHMIASRMSYKVIEIKCNYVGCTSTRRCIDEVAARQWCVQLLRKRRRVRDAEARGMRVVKHARPGDQRSSGHHYVVMHLCPTHRDADPNMTYNEIDVLHELRKNT